MLFLGSIMPKIEFGKKELDALIGKVKKNHNIELKLIKNPVLFLNSLIELNKRVNTKLIEKAYYFALKQHAGQMRASGEPYFVHLYSTADTLAELGADSEIVAAGLLHDVIEDTYVDEELFVNDFGANVYSLVKGVSKLKYLTEKSGSKGKDSSAYYLKTLMNSSIQDIRILIIKLADKLHNASTLEYLSKEQQLRISRQILDIYVPLAQIIGLHPIADQLADYSFLFAYPKEYKIVKKFVDAKREKQLHLIDSIISKIKTESEKYNLNISFVKELKPYYLVYLELYKDILSKEELYDFISLNVITKDIQGCYVTMGIAHSLYHPIPQLMRDYIATPQLIYSGLHTTLICNGSLLRVRIRTKAMDDMTRYGLIKILKEKKDVMHSLKNKWLHLKQYKIMKSDEDFVDALKQDFLELHVYFFDDKGKVMRLPIDSTIIDYIYEFKQNKATKLEKAKVNGKVVPLWYSLNTSDIVKLSFSKHTTLNQDWLDYAKSPRVRELILKDLKMNLNKSKESGHNALFIVDAIDRMGLLADIARIIADKKGLIQSDLTKRKKGNNIVSKEFIVTVKNKKVAEEMASEIRELNKIIRVRCI